MAKAREVALVYNRSLFFQDPSCPDPQEDGEQLPPASAAAAWRLAGGQAEPSCFPVVGRGSRGGSGNAGEVDTGGP